MHPCHLSGTEFGRRFIQLHALHLYVVHTLPMVRLGPLGSHPLEAMDRLEVHGSDGRRARITDAPALTFQELFHGRFRKLAAGHQSAFPCRKLPAACHTAQPCDVLVRPWPRPRRDVAFTRTIEPYTLWSWA
jgi:hypothetical protein